MPDDTLAPSPGALLRESLGEIDVYLFDQILRGRFDRRPRVLDAGCGTGRNLVFFLRQGFEAFGIDREAAAVARVRALARELSPGLPAENFREGEIDSLPWGDAAMDAVVCSAVLHFAEDEAHFARMLRETWRVLAPGGLFFARLASTIGMDPPPRLDARRRARLPDGSERFLVDEGLLFEWTRRLGAEPLDPVKTTVVQNLRCMTTWCLLKGG